MIVAPDRKPRIRIQIPSVKGAVANGSASVLARSRDSKEIRDICVERDLTYSSGIKGPRAAYTTAQLRSSPVNAEI